MFENFLALFTEKEQKEVVKVKPRVSRSLEHVLANAGRGKIIRGVDSYHLALVTIHKKGDLYLLGVQLSLEMMLLSSVYREGTSHMRIL
jgi:hypothetical protein